MSHWRIRNFFFFFLSLMIKGTESANTHTNRHTHTHEAQWQWQMGFIPDTHTHTHTWNHQTGAYTQDTHSHPLCSCELPHLQPRPVQVCAPTYTACVYVCNEGPCELWMREFDGAAVHPRVTALALRGLTLDVRAFSPPSSWIIFINFGHVYCSCEGCVPSSHGGCYWGC